MDLATKEESSSGDDEGRRISERDEENGEMIIQKIYVLRKSPQRSLIKAKARPNSACWDHYRWRPFIRRQKFPMRHGSELGINFNVRKELGIFHNQRSFEYNHVDVDPVLYMYWNTYGERPLFRVPSKYFHKNNERKKASAKAQDTQFINIWEEFIYGTSVVNKNYLSNAIQDGDKSITAAIQMYLGRFLSEQLVNVFIYFIHFAIYMISMSFYNLIWSCLGYILLDGHIRIHERAYKANINVVFGGNGFQGPAYVLVRNWCEHCQQLERERMSIRLMEKMKIDILHEQKMMHDKHSRHVHI